MRRTTERTVRERLVPALLATVVALVAGGRTGAAQAVAAPGGLVAGVVRDAAGNEIAGAEVLVGGTALRTRTDTRGAFQIRGVPLGPATLQVRRLGFEARSVPTTVAAATVELLDVVLDQVVQRLAPVLVHVSQRRYSGRMADFHRRRDANAGGYFITRARIDSQRPYRTTDLLRTVPGVYLQTVDVGKREVRMRGQRCPPLVWMDGMPILSGYFDPDNLDPRSIEAIEIYQGLASVPPALIGPRALGSCGVLAIWSRVDGPRGERVRADDKMTPTEVAALVDSLHVYTADNVDVPAGRDEANPFAPAYPDELRASRTSGLVIAEFVVDTAGSVEPSTVGLVSSSHRLFTDAVQRALLDASFTPAVRDGRPVRQLVQLPVRFVADEARAAAVPPPR